MGRSESEYITMNENQASVLWEGRYQFIEISRWFNFQILCTTHISKLSKRNQILQCNVEFE